MGGKVPTVSPVEILSSGDSGSVGESVEINTHC